MNEIVLYHVYRQVIWLFSKNIFPSNFRLLRDQTLQDAPFGKKIKKVYSVPKDGPTSIGDRILEADGQVLFVYTLFLFYFYHGSYNIFLLSGSSQVCTCLENVRFYSLQDNVWVLGVVSRHINKWKFLSFIIGLLLLQPTQ